MGSLRNLTNTKVNSAIDSFNLSYGGTLPVPRIPIYTVPQLRDALLGSSGSQAAILRNGKWISAISLVGFGNPTLDNLTSLSSSDIVGIRDSFSIAALAKLTNLNFPALATVGGSFSLSQSMNALTSINFPALVSIGASFSLGGTTS
jgi:hypothetical protein